jgi:hypothetical protein
MVPSWCLIRPNAMANAIDGTNRTKVLIDKTLLEQAEAVRPSYMSKTAWANHLIQQGLNSVAAKA